MIDLSSLSDIPLAWTMAESVSHRDPLGSAVFRRPPVCEYMSNSDDRLIYAETPETAVIAMAATEGLRDWLVNATVVPDPMGFHTGFARAVEYVHLALRDLLQRPGPEILLTGHSQGGGLLPRLAHDITTIYGRCVRIVSFGAPPSMVESGLRRFERLGIMATRVICDDDPVEARCLPLRREGIRLQVHNPKRAPWPFWRTLQAHFWSSYTRAIGDRCRATGDLAGTEAMRAILDRGCTI